jgi:type III pantothenate kinase
MRLIDFGNTRAHVWHAGSVEHMEADEALRRYGSRKIHYINVNKRNHDLLSAISGWYDMGSDLHLDGDYPGMGTDRKALCLARSNGILVDAGSAVTVDKMVGGVYAGGLIYPGFKAMSRAYASVSPILDVPFDSCIDLSKLPRSTPHSVSFGTIAPIVALIEQIREDMPVWITGGDGELIASFVQDAVYDEGLVFEGMMNALRSSGQQVTGQAQEPIGN